MSLFPMRTYTIPMARHTLDHRAGANSDWVRKTLDVPEDTKEELEALRELGHLITQLTNDSRLGPRAGISDAGRILRGVRLKVFSCANGVLSYP